MNKAFYTFGLFTLLCCLPLSGGERARIGGPRVLNNVKYKVVVMEYDTPGQDKWGRDIAQMIAHQILASTEGVSGFGVVTLEQPEDRIQLSGKRLLEEAENQNALLLVWGEFYSTGEDVYVYSHLRILPREEFPAAAFGLKILGEDINSALEGESLQAALPTLQVNFNPIKVPRTTLEKIHDFYQQTITLRKSARENAGPSGSLKIGDPYYLLEKRGDWTKVQVYKGPSGWIRYSVLKDQGVLTDLQGVVRVAQGVLYFISGNYSESYASLDSYLNRYAARQDNMNRAFAHILAGNARFWEAKYLELRKLPPRDEVTRHYYQALQLLPDHPAPVNHLTIVNMVGFWKRGPDRETLPLLEKKLIDIINTSKDPDALANLQTVYRCGMAFPTYWGKGAVGNVLERRINKIKSRVEKISEIKGER